MADLIEPMPVVAASLRRPPDAEAMTALLSERVHSPQDAARRLGGAMRISDRNERNKMAPRADGYVRRSKVTPEGEENSLVAVARQAVPGAVLEGTGAVRVDGGNVASGSAGYIAIEKITGRLDGEIREPRAAAPAYTMNRGAQRLTMTVVPIPAREELQVAGRVDIQIEGGKLRIVLEFRPEDEDLFLAGPSSPRSDAGGAGDASSASPERSRPRARRRRRAAPKELDFR